MKRTVAVVLGILAVVVAAGYFASRSGPAGLPRAERVAGAREKPWFFRTGGDAGEPAALPASAPEVDGVRGRVVDAITGVPVSAELRLLLRSEPVDVVWSAVDGRFEFPPGAPEFDRLAARSEGYGTAVRRVQPGEEVRVALDRAVTVRGRVVDDARAPIRDAWVVVSDVEGFEWPRPQSSRVRTDADGAFEIADAPPGGLLVEAGAAGFTTESGKAGALGPGRIAVPVEITLHAAGSIAGRVTARGEPVAGARIQIDLSRERDAVPGRVTFMSPRSSRSDAGGEFAFDGVAPGLYRLSASESGTGSASGSVVVAARERARADLSLEERNGVAGTVSDEDGQPIGDAAVIALGMESESSVEMTLRSTTTDARGGFRISGFKTPKAQLTVEAEGWPTWMQVVALPETNLAVRLPGGARVRGTIRGPGGAEWKASRGRVSARKITGEDEGAEGTGAEVVSGRFELRSLSAGRWELEFRDPLAGQSDPVVLDLSGRETKEATLTLRAAGTVTGRVTAQGKPVVGAWVGLAEASFGSSEAIDRSTAMRTGGDGRFAVPFPHTGGSLFVFHPEYRSEIRQGLQPREGETLDVGEIALRPGDGASSLATDADIGASVVEKDGGLVLADVDPEGPAAKAGLEDGAKLQAIDGTLPASADDANARLEGIEGTTVTLTVGSPPDAKEVVVSRGTGTQFVLIMQE